MRLNFLVVLLVGALFWGGCSSFERDFKAAKAAAQPAGSVAGAWEGTWQSDNGHGCGRLRCLLTPQGEGSYQARFKATFWGIFKASYNVTLRGAGQQGGTLLLAGEENLGWLAGGEYRYKGRVTPTDFTCTYDSGFDHGTFMLKRPAPPVPAATPDASARARP